jgi:MoaA/NifB/PqqE/SkfB family radical SAM enzyme
MNPDAVAWLEPEEIACVPLRNVFLHVTKACNLHCTYCYFSARKPMADEMTTGEFAVLWPQLAALQPRKVVLTGGEPLVRRDILELLQGLRDADPEHRIKRCLNTNGHLVTPDLVRRLVGLADEVRVSLDGLRETNDALRGRGNFDAAFRALKTFYDAGFEPKILITIMSGNVDDLEALICLLFENKLTRLSFNNFRPIGRGEGRWDWRADPQAVRGALARAWRRCHPDDPPREESAEMDEMERDQCHCGVGTMLNILPNGDVFPCHVLTSPEFCCGNVREQNLLEICRASGLLGDLVALDFRELAQADERLTELARPGICMGNVYAKTKQSTVWSKRLPILGQS